jgi:hypothetical protein
MWLYPLPSLIALLGWLFVLATSGANSLLVGLVSLVFGIIAFLIWSRTTNRWPFAMETLRRKAVTDNKT